MRPVLERRRAAHGQGHSSRNVTDSNPPRNPRRVDDASVSHQGYVVRAEATADSIHRP